MKVYSLCKLAKTALLGATKLAKAIIMCTPVVYVVYHEVLIILLHRSIHRLKFSLKSVNLCKFMAWCTDVLADRPHPRLGS